MSSGVSYLTPAQRMNFPRLTQVSSSALNRCIQFHDLLQVIRRETTSEPALADLGPQLIQLCLKLYEPFLGKAHRLVIQGWLLLSLS